MDSAVAGRALHPLWPFKQVGAHMSVREEAQNYADIALRSLYGSDHKAVQAAGISRAALLGAGCIQFMPKRH